MKLTRKKAFELSIKKWELIVENDGKNLDVWPKDLDSIMSHCGLCQFYGCKDCPLNLDGLCCVNWPHPWSIWRNDQTKENAQAVLELIKSKQ